MIPLSLAHPQLTNCQLIKQHNKAHQGTLLLHGLVMLNGHSITVYTAKCLSMYMYRFHHPSFIVISYRDVVYRAVGFNELP